MTTALTTPTLLATPAPSRWAELVLVGGLTPLLFPLSWLLQRVLGLDAAELAVGFTMFHAAHLINDPHFAVTYLLFYDSWKRRGEWSRAQRLRYLGAGVAVPVLLGAWIAVALAMQSSTVLGVLIQAMFFLVGWHYVKQGFGALMVLSARRGVTYLPLERTILLAHCYTGWAFAWANPHDPGREVVEKGVVYRTLAHPAFLEPLALALLSLSTIALVVMLLAKRRREGRWPPLSGLVGLLSSIWAWLVFSNADPLVRYVVPALHGLQYLYFVRMLSGGRAREREGPPHFETSAGTKLAMLALSAVALGFLLFRGLPPVLDAVAVPAAGFDDPWLGATPWFAAIYAFVNVHHYFMDAVIWRRDNPDTRYLAHA